MKLFVWRHVGGFDNQKPSSLAFAFADSKKEAIDQVAKDLILQDLERPHLRDLLDKEPAIFDFPVGYFFEDSDNRV